jgi:hypothetical protein
MFLAVAEADGSPRFGRLVSPNRGLLGAAVDPAGRVAMVTRGGACDDVLERWNLAGDFQWRRQLGASGCPVTTSMAVDASSHDVLVGGWFMDAIDVGTGPIASRGGSDDLVVDVLP